ncbi:hypothetical protein PLESTB_001175000 [Pleodorina starrii]|uniref:Uncharacterized protein n=1 Tax=Pleodorina starrii TaxID=330485 RepID=A0A9W6F5I2_9CHLO|nr:hypothetical protein PLESTB_001175000 [Pleodorina starrii]GLC64861.1 hypothetical protein PLESTF_000215200 [Pleodorina starrii]
MQAGCQQIGREERRGPAAHASAGGVGLAAGSLFRPTQDSTDDRAWPQVVERWALLPCGGTNRRLGAQSREWWRWRRRRVQQRDDREAVGGFGKRVPQRRGTERRRQRAWPAASERAYPPSGEQAVRA